MKLCRMNVGFVRIGLDPIS